MSSTADVETKMDNTSEAAHSADDSSNIIRFDELGPIIINTDGSLQRIPNWHSLTEIEQAKALRLIAARNKKRLEKLKEEGKEQSENEHIAAEPLPLTNS
jgi:hypothetical protein